MYEVKPVDSDNDRQDRVDLLEQLWIWKTPKKVFSDFYAFLVCDSSGAVNRSHKLASAALSHAENCRTLFGWKNQTATLRNCLVRK